MEEGAYMKKRIASLALVIFSIFTFTLPTATAAEIPDIEPYYIGLSRITLSLDVQPTALGADYATVYGLVRLYSGYSADVTLTLQRSLNEKDWEEVETWEDSGEVEIRITDELYVVSGYSYRLAILVIVYYEDGSAAEIVTKYGPIQP